MDTALPVDLSADSDLDLVQRCRDGNIQAFNLLMRRHNQQLYRAARSILHNESDAEDAVQEAWWKAFQHMQDFLGQSQVSTWLTRIAVNEALMLRRRNKTRDAIIQSPTEQTSEDHAMNPPGAHLPGPDDSRPDHAVWRAEVRRQLETQIDQLPDIYRAVFMLRGVQEMSVAEVAQALDIPEATVRVRHMRARRLLQAGLKAEFDTHMSQAFSFAGERCNRIVAGVHARLRAAGILID